MSVSPVMRGEMDVPGFSLGVETATIPSSVSCCHCGDLRGLCWCFLKIHKTRFIFWRSHWCINPCCSLSCASLFSGRYASSIRAGYGDWLPMVGGRPEELTSVKMCCLGWAGFWSGREAHVQRLRHGRESQALERAMHCGESGGRQWKEQTLKEERGSLGGERWFVYIYIQRCQ